MQFYKKPILLLLDHVHGYILEIWMLRLIFPGKSIIPSNITLLLFLYIYICISLKKLHWGKHINILLETF